MVNELLDEYAKSVEAIEELCTYLAPGNADKYEEYIQSVDRLYELGRKEPYYQPGRVMQPKGWTPLVTPDATKLALLKEAVAARQSGLIGPGEMPKFWDVSSVTRPADRAAFIPSPPSPEMASRQKVRKPEIPNKMAQADPRWDNKVAFDSEALKERQKVLETYSVEVALVFEAVRTVASKVLGRLVNKNELRFVANFGSPITDNKQKVSIGLSEPVDIRVMLIRALVDGNLTWSADVSATEDTPLSAKGKLVDLKKASGDLPIDPVTATGGEHEQYGPQYRDLPSIERERRGRKVKL